MTPRDRYQARSDAELLQTFKIARVCRAAIEEYRKPMSFADMRMDAIDENLVEAVMLRLARPGVSIPRNPEGYLFASIVLALGYDFSEAEEPR